MAYFTIINKKDYLYTPEAAKKSQHAVYKYTFSTLVHHISPTRA